MNATTRRDEDNNIVGVVGVAQASRIDLCLFYSIDLFSILDSAIFFTKVWGRFQIFRVSNPIILVISYIVSLCFCVYVFISSRSIGCNGVKEA